MTIYEGILTKMNCPINKDECPCPEYSKEGFCDYPYKSVTASGEIKTIREMVHWKFKCLKCGHRFRAMEPMELYEAYNECATCGSRDIEKSMTKE